MGRTSKSPRKSTKPHPTSKPSSQSQRPKTTSRPTVTETTRPKPPDSSEGYNGLPSGYDEHSEPPTYTWFGFGSNKKRYIHMKISGSVDRYGLSHWKESLPGTGPNENNTGKSHEPSKQSKTSTHGMTKRPQPPTITNEQGITKPSATKSKPPTPKPKPEEPNIPTIEFVKDKFITDCTVYSTKGDKLDYITVTKNAVRPYRLDDDDKMNAAKTDAILKNATFKNGNYIIKKSWLLRNTGSTNIEGARLVPTKPIDKNSELEVLIDPETTIDTIPANAEFEVSTELRIPDQPGIFRREFFVVDKVGNRLSKKIWIVFRVVPADIKAPVSGDIGDMKGPMVGLPVGEENYDKADTYYFCNWGVYYWDRTGKKARDGRSMKDIPNTHKTYDRYAWDVNGKDNFDDGKKVYAVSSGKVIHTKKDFGAVWIHHDYVKGHEDTTGYIAVYMHMSESSWEGGSDIWDKSDKQTVSVDADTVLGTIAGRSDGVENERGSHLHIAIYPLPCGGDDPDGDGKLPSNSNDWYFGFQSVHTDIKQYNRKATSKPSEQGNVSEGPDAHEGVFTKDDIVRRMDALGQEISLLKQAIERL